MAAGSNRKKQRKPKKSLGIHGATKHPLSGIEKALLGKGQVQAMQHVPCKAPYKGGHGDRPYDKAQADLNRELYPHLF